MKNKTKRFITFGLLLNLVFTMINPTYLTSVGTVYAADNTYTVQYEDFTDDGNGVLTNFSGDIGSASIVEFPASLTYTKTINDNGTPDDTNDDETEEHTITPTYGSGVFNADSLAQKTFKFADGVKINVKMQDAVATRIEFDGDVNLVDVTAESYFADNKNIDTVEGCGFLFSDKNSSSMQFNNSSVKHVSFKIPSSVVSSLKASHTFGKTTLESLSISGGTFTDVGYIFSEATITKDVLASLLDHVDSGVISGLDISRLLKDASVSGFDTQKELIDYVSSKVSSVARISSAFDTKVPEQGTTLDLSSFKMQSGSSGSQLMVIENSANYSKYILPEFSGDRYITSSKDIYRFNDDKTLTCVKGSSTENITVKSKETILMNAATVNIHADTVDTKYLSSIYTFAEVLGTDTKYTATEGGTEEFDMTQKPEVSQTYDLYPLDTKPEPDPVEPEVPSDVEIDTGDMTTETTVKYSDDTTGTVADGTIKFTFTEKEDSAIPTPAKKYTNYRNAVVREITPSIGNKNITELGSSVTITEELPADYNQTKNGGIKVLNFHDGVDADPVEIDATVNLTDGTFSYTTDKFSMYVLLYNTTAENMTNWTATINFDDNNDALHKRPTSLMLHIYVNDVEYTTKNVAVSGASVNVSVSVPETVADNTAEVTWDLDGAGNSAIEGYGDPGYSEDAAGTPVYTYTYGGDQNTLEYRVSFRGDTGLDSRPESVTVRTTFTYGTGVNAVELVRVLEPKIDENLSYNDFTTTYPDTLDGKTLTSVSTTWPTVNKYTAQDAQGSGTAKHTVTYVYNGGFTATINLKVNFADVGHTSSRPASISAKTVETFEDGTTRTITSTIPVDKDASYTNYELTYDTVNDSGKGVTNLVTTWPGIENYVLDKTTTEGLTEHSVIYTFEKNTTVYTLKAQFKNDVTDPSTRPETVTAKTFVKYADGQTDTITTDLTVPKNTTFVSKEIEYDNQSSGGADIISVTTTWSEASNYSMSVDKDAFTYSTATYTLALSNTLKVSVDFSDEDNKYNNRPDTITVPVVITYEDDSTKTYTAVIDVKSGVLNTDVAYAKINPDGATAKSAKATFPEINGYSNTAGANTMTNQSATYSQMYYNKTMQVKFSGDSSDKSTRPDSIDIDTAMTYKDGLTVDNTITLNITAATNAVTLSAPTYNNKSNYDSFTWSFPEISGYTMKESGSTVTYTYDTSSDTGTVKVTLKFDDDSNTSGLRPKSVKITLTNVDDSSDTISTTITISDPTTTTTNSYEGSAKKTKANRTYKISKIEDGGSSSDNFGKYKASYDGLTATMSMSTETKEIELKASWSDDADNADGTRPSSLSVKIKNGDSEIKSVTLNSDNGWSNKVKVNKYIKGVEASYSYSFPDITNYSKSVSDTSATYKFTGTLSKDAAAKQAAANAAANGTTTGDGEDHTYDIEYFDWIDYANRYPDLKKAFGYNKEQLYAHYIHYGIGEHRIATWTGKYANVNEDVLAAYFPDDYKYKTNLSTSSGDSKYSDITGDTSSTTTSKSGDASVTTDENGNTVIKKNNGDGTTTETILDENGEVLSTRTYATGDARTELLYVFYIIVLAIAGIIIGLCSTDIIKINKNRKKAISLIHTID